ncbi:nuclear transport factor 2 family protein [Streptomyces telluris]|uniref:Nuclear transport factor 2 family protein n=1 Tax=Streptomyces telluris TaxID=2720021 RepID=A0A9X2LKV0_9ACTN|nr:nuclear transport factor 2 family protein [Streptomyces telluris]MCQ8773194.1 nuclear transport factor 2 family protein [Streptomyces telluris]NJP79750.1 nuclear transport factor 2 family protein [Streptomyces telluris]
MTVSTQDTQGTRGTRETAGAPETVGAREFAALQARVGVLADRADITGLIDRYLLGLDTVPADGGRFDDAWARSLFTPDVRIVSPVGVHEGIDGLAESEQATLAKFERTQHMGANYMIGLDGDRATVRWNALMTHVHLASTHEARGTGPGDHFTVGGTFTGEAVRTPEGWRFRHLDIRAVWVNGQGPLVLTPKAEETLRSL